MDYANPMYDVVFKFLMEDNTQAIRLIAALTGLDIVSVTPMPQELTTDTHTALTSSGKLQLSVYRLDYAARIKDKKGRELIVLIEIQQKKIHRQDMRFRKYIARQYLNSTSYTLAKTLTGQSYKVGIPILLIFFLGEQLEHFKDTPILLVDLTTQDGRTMTPLSGTNHFIDALFHKGIIINTPALNPQGGTTLEDVLAIFSPAHKTTNPHIMHINEATYPSQYRGLLRRLQEAAAEEDIRAKMLLEDDFFAEMQFIEEQLKHALNEKEEALRKSEAERKQKEEALRKSEIERRQKEAALRKSDAEHRQKKRAIQLLLDLGMPKDEIGRQLGLSEAELNDF